MEGTLLTGTLVGGASGTPVVSSALGSSFCTSLAVGAAGWLSCGIVLERPDTELGPADVGGTDTLLEVAFCDKVVWRRVASKTVKTANCMLFLRARRFG